MSQRLASQCLVVMYHYVRTRGEPISRGVRGLSPSAFEEQLDELSRWGEPLSWEAFARCFCGKGELPRRSFLLTFDDGLLDHVEVVAPILGERGLRGLFFVPGRVLHEPRVLSAHQVHLLLSIRTPEELYENVAAALARLAPGDDWLDGMNPVQAERLYAYESPERARLKHLLTGVLPISLRNHVLADLFARHVGSSAEWSRKWYLSPAQVVELHRAGHTIGGHSYAHEPLARLTRTELEHDVHRSARTLADLLGDAPRPFSYPFGSFNDDVIDGVRQAGFCAAVTTQSRPAHPADEAFALPRIDTIHVSAHLESEKPCPV
ncbi:MAG: polysaccharide deacetylase family protein [Phycisphaerales bacterium]|nr:polysaccharide deacetylase family protein [Phycisphaerales bacterium]